MATGSQAAVRRSANYQPSIWDYHYIQSITSDYKGETCAKRLDMLKREVQMILAKVEKPLDQLEMIDLLQRLGISYQFEDDIKRMLNSICWNYNMDDKWTKESLQAAALAFRVLRQHGQDIPPDIFTSFKDEQGSFKVCLCEDIEGILSLYEASYLAIKGEGILEEAREFAKKHLENWLLEQNIDKNLGILVRHALEFPLHWRVPRFEVRWFIDAYERRKDINSKLLEFAKLDYNMVQAKHQEDLKYASEWWRSTGLGEKLSFVRDRLMVNFLVTVGQIFEPQFGYYRRMETKMNSLLTVIDDIYDVYGTLDELELFTDAVDRWDMNAMDQLPGYMKICFLALYNTINEMAYDILKEQGFHVISYLRKAWADLCKSYFLEAKWYHTGYMPTLEEYMNNAWTSITAPVILVHAYFLATNPITEEALKSLESYCDVIRGSSIIFRLANDLQTSSDELKRGDTIKSVQCYMIETGASEEDAREHILNLIGETWKKLNEDRVMDSPYFQTFVQIALNLARVAQSIYQCEDGFGIQDGQTKKRVISLLIEPIPIV